MGNRITKVYTRSGDDGSTGKADGTRVAKNSALITAIGEVDELNATIGLLRAEALSTEIEQQLSTVQNDLFAIGGELAMPEFQAIGQTHIENLEAQIDQHNAILEPLKEFILPAGSRAVAQCHMARTICRRAERSLVSLKEQQAVRNELLQYLNRLSDALFVMARAIGKADGVDEVYWGK